MTEKNKPKKQNVIEFNNVSKVYKLYKNDRHRLLAAFINKIPYKEKKAVDGVSFRIQKGESVALFGRNGAGKSTILKMITGVSYPTKGNIKIRGRVSALLELTSGFDPEMTGRENIYLKGQIMGVSKEEIKKLESEIIAFADIGDYIDQKVRTYSSGMKARLGFAVNININPEILIVDEALSVGDRAFRKKCLARVREVMAKENLTLLFVTHSTVVAKEFCKRGIVMQNGHLIYDSDIESAIEEYDKTIK